MPIDGTGGHARLGKNGETRFRLRHEDTRERDASGGRAIGGQEIDLRDGFDIAIEFAERSNGVHDGG